MRMVKTIREIAEEVCDRMGYNSPEVIDLIIETGWAESGYRHLEQVRGDAVGFFQIEPWVIGDCWDNFIIYRKNLIEIMYELGYREKYPVFSVLTNLALQIAFCRICYRRRPESIPKTMKKRAELWKKGYNTVLGKGTVEHYMNANRNNGK
tara:strand:- start:13656 stop:14108 length:453 start_codon:yes stop_codon:yes gene_type:complete